jgi:hypothetical protein
VIDPAAPCIYCGSADDLTADHVPPKSIFPEPRSSDLITVPACRGCNKSYELDDEYFRMAMTIAADQNPVAAALWQTKVVKGTLKRSPALKASLLRTRGEFDLRTPAGLFVGRIPVVSLSKDRVNRVAHRIVTALHWIHYGAVPAMAVRMRVIMAPDLKRPALLERLARELLGARPWHNVAGGVFRYAFDRVPDKPDWGAWLLMFYSAAAFLVLLTTEDQEAQ